MYVLYKAKNLYNTWVNGGPDGCFYNVSSNGWMQQDTFKDWFTSVFIAKTAQLIGPKLLVLDGHVSHITLDVINAATANNITILCLPPHSTHILQPLDVAVFKPVKTAWRDIVQEFQRTNRFKNIDKEDFPSLLKKLVESDKAFLRRHAVAGFETTGIYPVKRQAITSEQLKCNEAFASNEVDDDEAETMDVDDDGDDDDEDESDDENDDDEGDEDHGDDNTLTNAQRVTTPTSSAVVRRSTITISSISGSSLSSGYSSGTSSSRANSSPSESNPSESSPSESSPSESSPTDSSLGNSNRILATVLNVIQAGQTPMPTKT